MHRAVNIRLGAVEIAGDLTTPRGPGGEGPRGLVIFAHGSGSGRKSPRNRWVAGELNAAGFATLLFDLLTPEEEEAERHTGHLRFNIGLLAGRLRDVVDAAAGDSGTAGLDIGLFGASTGAAAALVAAAERPERVAAVVSRGGRPDLAGERLRAVRAPTLLLVGGRDAPVVALNREALESLTAPSRLEIIPGATHLFEERGALADVARRAGDWFGRYLGAGEQPGAAP
jgi:putative phosphoribosyl transferase